MKYLKPVLFIAALSVILLFTSCQTVPTNVPEDLSKADLIQLAQDSYEDGNVTAAEYYYQLIIDRFGDDPTARIVAQFEIAHIKIKDGDTKEARPLLEDIIAEFDATPELAYYIPEYLKLARIDLAKCE